MVRPTWAPPTWAPIGAARLAALSPDLRRALIRSGTDGDVFLDDDETWALLAEQGVPLRTIHLVLNDGTHFAFPGTATQLQPRDPHTEAWYHAAAGKRFLHWRVQEPGAEVADVTVSRSIFGTDDADFEGVVALVVRLPANLLAAPSFPKAWLLGPEGGLILAYGGQRLDPVVLGRIAPESSWVGTDGDGHLCASAPLPQIGWTYVGCMD